MLDGKKIRELRLSKGYTIEDVANMSLNKREKISKSYLGEIERMAKTNISFNKVVVISEILDCKLDDLVS